MSNLERTVIESVRTKKLTILGHQVSLTSIKASGISSELRDQIPQALLKVTPDAVINPGDSITAMTMGRGHSKVTLGMINIRKDGFRVGILSDLVTPVLLEK